MRLLLLEDDPDLGRAVAAHLGALGHRVRHCSTVAEAREATAREPPELALLDLQLPDGSGLGLLQCWRSAGAAWPVIVLTARDQVSDRIRGLKAGADDYLVKPFDLDELSARIDAITRRMPAAQPLQVGALSVDLETRQVRRDGHLQDLTQMEWAVLACLARRPGRIYSRDDIETRLEADGLAEARSNSLEVIVSRLRRKLGARCISTHRGLGYRLDG